MIEPVASSKPQILTPATGRSVPSSTSVSDPAAAFLAQQNLVVLSRVGQRMAFQHAASTGRGVVETEPKSKAAEEIVELWNAIKKRSS